MADNDPTPTPPDSNQRNPVVDFTARRDQRAHERLRNDTLPRCPVCGCYASDEFATIKITCRCDATETAHA